jgi:hypothetical protein
MTRRWQHFANCSMATLRALGSKGGTARAQLGTARPDHNGEVSRPRHGRAACVPDGAAGRVPQARVGEAIGAGRMTTPRLACCRACLFWKRMSDTRGQCWHPSRAAVPVRTLEHEACDCFTDQLVNRDQEATWKSSPSPRS